MYIYFNKLDNEDWHRKQPLAELGAEYRNIDSKVWNKVVPSMNIAKKCYNDLSEVWINFDEWRFVDTWDEKRMDIIGQNGNIGYE